MSFPTLHQAPWQTKQRYRKATGLCCAPRKGLYMVRCWQRGGPMPDIPTSNWCLSPTAKHAYCRTHCQSRESRCSRSQSRFPVAHGRHLGRADIHSSACDGPQTVASWCRDTAACVKQIYPELSQPRERTHAGEERGKKSEKDGVAENSSYSSALGAIWNARNKLEKPEMSWGGRGKEGRSVCIFSLFLIIQL